VKKNPKKEEECERRLCQKQTTYIAFFFGAKEEEDKH
jgi:hypothetical protein